MSLGRGSLQRRLEKRHCLQLPLYFQPQWDNDNIYLIMEFCAGGDLSRFIHTRRILPEKVARVFMQQLGKSLRRTPCSLLPYPSALRLPMFVSLLCVGSSGFHMWNMM